MLERLGREAAGAVSRAREEAFSLGHRHIGTEHLLLGLLAGTGTAASDALIAAGASLVSVREKVFEALASRSSGSPGGAAEELPFTDRANRALDRAGRLSLRSGSDHVGCEHLLLSVLDVEGTAGQVLRGLAVDPDTVREALRSLSHGHPSPDERRPEPSVAAAGPRCGTCGSSLANSLQASTLAVSSGESVVPVEVYYCRICGTAMGAARA